MAENNFEGSSSCEAALSKAASQHDDKERWIREKKKNIYIQQVLIYKSNYKNYIYLPSPFLTLEVYLSNWVLV